MLSKVSEWDKYFLGIAESVAANSKCLSRKIGAILVQDKIVISEGYNGPPRGVPHCGAERMATDYKLQEAIRQEPTANIHELTHPSETCPRQLLGYKSGEGLEWCIAGHAERNALISAARLGIAVKGATMYMSCPTPCTPCLIEIMNAGVKEIVFTEWHYYDLMSEWLLHNGNIMARTYDVGATTTE